MHTSQRLQLGCDLPALLDSLHCLAQAAGVGWREGYLRGITSCVVQDEAGVGVHQEDRCASSQEGCSAEGVPRIGLQHVVKQD